MKFLWLDINCSYAHSSLALPALHAQLPKELTSNTEWSVVRGTTKTAQPQLIEQVIKQNPDYIFSSCWLFNTEYLSGITARIKSLVPSVSIILGGPEFLGDNSEYLMRNPQITAVFNGDGEEMFCSFIESLASRNSNWMQITGFEYITKNGYHSSQIAQTQDFAKLKQPYESEFFNLDKPFVQLETSRGCFNSCKFCVSGIQECKIQDLNINQIRTSLEYFYSHGIKEIRVLDRTFNANSMRSIELVSLFKEYYGKLKFHLEIHPALISAALMDILKNVPEGLLHLEAGIQSLNQDVITLSGRKGNCTKTLEGLTSLTSLKLFDVHADLIAGLPGYTYSQCIKDLFTLMHSNVAEIQLELLKLLPGTVFRNRASEFNICYSPVPPYEVLKTDQITFNELNLLMNLSKAVDFWFNKPQWRSLFLKIADSTHVLEQIAAYMYSCNATEQPLSQESRIMLLYDFCNNLYPDKKPLVSLYWIRNGLSLKKKPAEVLTTWEVKSGVPNPFVESCKEATAAGNKFYYMEYEDNTVWFWFNQSLKRIGPYNEFISKTNKN